MMIKVKVYEVGPPYPLNPAPVLWLTDEKEETMLILTIGMAEAIAIKSQISEDEEPPPRPMTHDLLKSVFEHLNAAIQFIVITELREQSYYVAEIHADAAGRSVVIDSRPSDAIALALRAGAPIYVMEEVMRVAGKRMVKQKSELEEHAAELTQEMMEEAVNEPARETRKKDTPLEAAKRQLQAAIEEERYEDAARLRDEIKKLEQNA
jgi:bifunctional DNase/RNase